MRHNLRRDANDLEIFRALEAAYCEPVRGRDSDIYCRSRTDGQGMILEVKTKEGRLRPIHVRLQALFGPRYAVVRSVDEALRACGVSI